MLYWKKKRQTVFNNCNITVECLLYNLQKIKKCMYTVVCGGKTLVKNEI